MYYSEESSLLIGLIILAFLILLNAYFAASEMALISLNDTKIRLQAEAGDKKAILLVKLLSEPSRFLATIQVGITLAGFLASAFAADNFAERLAAFLYAKGVPLPLVALQNIAMVIITLILSYFTLVFGELVPKRIAMKKADKIARSVIRPLIVLSKVTSPFVRLLSISTNGVVRLFGIDPKVEDENVTEEEIRMMVDVGEEKGTIQNTEKRMINNIFEFDNITVSDIMTHRVQIVAIPMDMDLKNVIHIVNEEQFSRYPVYVDDIDNIVGILHIKDLFKFIETHDEEEFSLEKIIRKPLFVPDSRIADDLFHELKRSKVHMAVVIDEYGGTAGIITIEDLLEEIVGNIFDEHDEEDPDIKKINENTFVLSGTLSLLDAERALDIDFPTEEHDTISGFLIGHIGYIPFRLHQDESEQFVDYEGFRFIIQEADEKRIKKVLAIRLTHGDDKDGIAEI